MGTKKSLIIALALRLFALSVLGQAQPAKQEHAPMKQINGINVLNNDNWKSEIMENPAQTHYLMLFQTKECKACRSGINELARMAQLNEGKNSLKIGYIDCMTSKMLCKIWGALSTEDPTEPFLILVRNRHVYRFESNDELTLPAITEWLMKTPESSLITDNLVQFVVQSERDVQVNARKPAEQQLNWAQENIPGFVIVEDTFDAWLRTPISYFFHTIGLDYYGKYSKIALFTLLVLVPFILAVVVHGIDFLLDVIDPAPQLIKVPQQAESQSAKVESAESKQEEKKNK